MNRLESDDLRSRRVRFAQQLLQVFRIVMAKYKFGNSAVPNPLDHGRMVPGVGIDFASCNPCGNVLIARHLTHNMKYESSKLILN